MATPHVADWIRRYYLLTPVFAVLDGVFGFSFRISGITDPGYRLAWYGLCLLCALGCYLRPRQAALIAVAESSGNLLILFLGILLPIFRLGDLEPATLASVSANAGHMLNFLLSGAILILMFHSALGELHNPVRLDESQP